MSNLNLNKVILGGRITADPELKQTQGGTAVTSFSVAVNRRYAKDGEQTADFINVVAWRGTAEFIAKYFKKGSSIALVGSLQTRSWTDQSGNKRYATEVIADEAYFVDSNSDVTTSGEGNAVRAEAYNAPAFEPVKPDEDLTF